MNPQFLFQTGWIVSVVVATCFVVRQISGLFLRERVFSVRLFPATGHSHSPKSRLSPVSILISVVIFVVAFVSRYWLSRFMFGPWYFADEAFDSCIMPYQLSQGETIWGGGTNYLTYLSYLTAYRFFGFGAGVARMVNMLVFSGSVVVVFWALHGAFGKKVSGFVLGMMLLSSPFITHSMYATAITFSLLPSSVILFILTRPLTDRSATQLGIALTVGLYLFPAAFLTGICLVFFHAVIFHREWTSRERIIVPMSFALSWISAFLVRRMLTGNSHWNQWAGGFLSFDRLVLNILVVLRDLFWESLSWNTLNLGMPYLDTAAVGFLIIGVGSSLMPTRPQPPLQERQWIWVSVLSILGSVALSALTGPYPGVRRIFPSILLIYLIAGLGLRCFWRWTALRPYLLGVVIICLGLVALRSYVIAHTSWPLSGRSDFMMAARETLLRKGHDRQEVVIIAYNSDQYLAQHYRCALGLDEALKTRFKSVSVVHHSRLYQGLNLPDDVILFANELFSDSQLQDIVGSRPYVSTIRRPFTLPQPEVLAAIYEFTKKP